MANPSNPHTAKSTKEGQTGFLLTGKQDSEGKALNSTLPQTSRPTAICRSPVKPVESNKCLVPEEGEQQLAGAQGLRYPGQKAGVWWGVQPGKQSLLAGTGDTVAGEDPDSSGQGKPASVWPSQASNFKSATERIGLTSLDMPAAAKFCVEFNPALHQRNDYFCT